MKNLEQFTAKALYRLRKSDIELISKTLKETSSNQNAIYLARNFAILLKQIRSVDDEAELSHVTGISAQLAMTGMWNEERAVFFPS